MKIAHIGLASYYTDGMTYQDNQLAEQNVRDGHTTIYVSNAAKYVNGEIVETGYEDVVLESGVRLIRLPYVKVINSFVTEKFRKVKGLFEILDEFKPDVILAHDLAFYSALDIVKYKKKNMNVKLYVDTHTADYNSGRNWLSLHILHRGFYKYLVQKSLKYIEKYLYVGLAEKKFSVENYSVPESIMEFFPMGTQIMGNDEYEEKRITRRRELGIDENALLFVHSGKLDELKKTDVLLEAFAKVPSINAKLVIIGSIPEERQELLSKCIAEDGRVEFLGWKSGEELVEFLCACDLYCQPGSVSATLQNAVGCKCPVMCYPHEGYKAIDTDNFIWVENEKDIVSAFERIVSGEINLSQLVINSETCTNRFLDYKQISKVLYQ